MRFTIYSLYGEAAVNPKTLNLLGKPWQVYDESGKTESVAFDFKGNLLSKKQQVISSAELKAALDNYQTYLVDWTGLPAILSTQLFETSSEYDALNRVTRITLPENVNNERKEIVPTYNRAGALEQVRYDGTVYVENIAYNAKGQRLLIAFGNDIMTRYVYQPTTFRLLRQRSEKFTKTQVGNTITYTPQSGTNRQDEKYIYDLIGNIFQIDVRTTGCGVGGSNSLDRTFEYDSLYRLTKATGRENVPAGNYPFPGWSDTTRSTDPNTTEGYTRNYQYDKLGNIVSLQQTGNNAFTRTFSYVSGQNILNGVSIGASNYTYSYDSVGNLLTENVNRHYEWDAENRLICFKNQVGSAEPTVLAQYLYDAGGNRVKKIVRKQGGSYEIRTYIDGIFEYFTDETEEQNTVHVMDNQSRVATIRIGDAMGDSTPAVQYVLENNIGSSTATLDDNGAEINQQEYYPFGETSFGSYTKKRYQYTGKERDNESGLYYYGARYYSPWICRFISGDPLTFDFPDKTPYHYSSNNPINRLDPNGMADEQAVNNTGGEDQGAQAAQNLGKGADSGAEKRAGEDNVSGSNPGGKSKSESNLTSSQIKNWRRLVKKGEKKFGLSSGGFSDDFIQFLITKTAGKSRFGNQKDVPLETNYTVKVVKPGGIKSERRGNERKKGKVDGNELTGWKENSNKSHNAVGDYSWIINMDAKSEKGTSFAEPVPEGHEVPTGGRNIKTKNMAVYVKVKPIHGFNVYLNTTNNATNQTTTKFINGKDYRPMPYYMNPVKESTVTIVSPSTPSDIENMNISFMTRATSTLSGTAMGMKGANSEYGIYKAYPFSQEIYSKNRVMGLNMDIFKVIGMPRK